MHYIMRLPLAGFVFGEREKSAAAAGTLKTWFLQPETKMQPNLKFGQGIPGVVQGRGSASMDMYFSGRGFIDAVQRIFQTSGLLEFKKWASVFTNYMFYDPGMQSEKRMRNNHGVYYDLNVLAWATGAENLEVIQLINGKSDCLFAWKESYNCFQGRFASQIDVEGVFIHEIHRADPSHYIWHALLANAYLATAGAKINNYADFGTIPS